MCNFRSPNVPDPLPGLSINEALQDPHIAAVVSDAAAELTKLAAVASEKQLESGANIPSVKPLACDDPNLLKRKSTRYLFVLDLHLYLLVSSCNSGIGILQESCAFASAEEKGS